MTRKDITDCSFKIKPVIGHIFPEPDHLPVIVSQFSCSKICRIYLLSQRFGNEWRINMMFIKRQPIGTLVIEDLEEVGVVGVEAVLCSYM